MKSKKIKGSAKGIESNRVKKTTQSALSDLLNQMDILNIIANYSADAITIFDMDFTIMYVSPAIVKLRGYSIEEVKKQTLKQILTSDSIKKALRIYREEFEKEKSGKYDPYRSITVELEYYCKNGSTIWLESHGSFIRDEKQKPIGILVILRDISKRKKTETEIINKQKQLEYILAYTPDATFVIDKNGYVIAWNKAIEDLTGVKGEDIIGKGNYEYSIPFYGMRRPILIDLALHFNEEFIKKYTYIIKKEKDVLIAEVMVDHFRGKKAYLWGKAAPLYDKDGNMVGAIETIRDITELKQKELLLLESEQKFRGVFDATADAIMIDEITESGVRIIDCNQQSMTMYGYESKEEILKGNIGDLSANEYPYTEEVAQEKIKLALQGEIPTFEWLARRKDGSVFWAEVTLKKVVLAGHERVLAVVRDINTRKKAEQELKESEERYRSLAESTQDLIILHNMNGIIQYVNRSAEELFGYRREEIIGKNIAMFIPAKYLKGTYERQVKHLLGYLEVEQYEAELINRYGVLIPVQITPSPIVKDDTIVSIMVVAHNLTQRKIAEELLIKTRERLEAAIAILQYDAKDAKDLFEYVLEKAIQLTGSKIGFILNYYEEEKKFILNAWSKEVMNQCTMVEKPEVYYLNEAGIWAETVRQARPIIINNYRDSHQNKKGYPEGHVELLRYLGIPIFKNEQIVATVGVANKDTDYTEMDVLQLTLFMDAAWKSYERMQITHALSESEAQFKTLADSSPTAIFMYQDDKFVYINKAAEQISGFNFDEAMTMEFWSMVHPDDRRMIINKGKNRQQGKTGIDSYEFRIVTKDGSVKWVYITSDTVQYRGKPAGLASILDITDRKVAEEQLQEEKEKLRVTLQSIGDGVIATDTQGRVRIINEAAQMLTGYSQQEALGKPLDEVFVIVHELLEKKLPNPVELVLRTDAIQELSNHTVLIAKDGTRRIIADSAAPIKDVQGMVIGVVLVFRDMTEKLQLIEQAQRAQRLESIGVLAAGIAHDFNNILEGVFGYIGLAQAYNKDGQVTEMLSHASKSIQRAKGLTAQLLTFSKGGQPIKKVQPIVPLIKEVVSFAISGSSVNAEFHFDDDCAHADFDYNQIAQVIENVTINAVQAMPSGGTITVRAQNISFADGEHALLEGDYIKITIKDQGVGIPKEVLPKIFDPFFTTKSMGQGLGLATSYSIITRHNGIIEVESEPEKGTCFFIYLPAVKTDSQKILVHEAEEKSLRGGRVLIMDDEPTMRELMTQFLEHLGFESVAVGTGSEAIETFIKEKGSNKPFDALIFDMTVKGGIGGKEAIVKIREMDTDVIAFVMSGYSDDPVLVHPDEHGFNGGLCKPFTIEELKQLFAKYF